MSKTLSDQRRTQGMSEILGMFGKDEDLMVFFSNDGIDGIIDDITFHFTFIIVRPIFFFFFFLFFAPRTITILGYKRAIPSRRYWFRLRETSKLPPPKQSFSRPSPLCRHLLNERRYLNTSGLSQMLHSLNAD